MHPIRKHHSFCIIFFINNPSRRMLYHSFQHNIVVMLLLIPYAWLKVVLFFFEKVATTANQFFRMVVPMFLRRIIFSLLYPSPATGHIREYKTLYRISLLFFWPRMRSNIHQWIKECPHCWLTFNW